MNIASIFKTFGDKAKRVRLDICPIDGGRIRLTLSPEPASGSERNAFVPLQADGTPEEVDADLDKALAEYFTKCAGHQTNLDQIDKHIKAIEERAEADRKAKIEKKTVSKASPSTPSKPQTDLSAKYGGAQTQKTSPEPDPDDLFAAKPSAPPPKSKPDEGTVSDIHVDPESLEEYQDQDSDDEDAA